MKYDAKIKGIDFHACSSYVCIYTNGWREKLLVDKVYLSFCWLEQVFFNTQKKSRWKSGKNGELAQQKILDKILTKSYKILQYIPKSCMILQYIPWSYNTFLE